MNLQPNLKNKSNSILISDLKGLVAKERQVLTEILQYLKEVAERKLYLERGYSSLFAFMREELGYSESAAQRRILAMRLVRDLPEAEKKIETGKLSLTVASQVQSFIRRENQQRKVLKKGKLTQNEVLGLVQRLEGTSTRECERKLVQMAPEIALPKEKTRAITEEKTLIQFVADKALMGKIEKLKALLSHRNIEGKYDQLFEKVIDMALDKLDPERRQERREKRKEKSEKKSKQSLPAPAVQKPNRHIPNFLRDRVWTRDKGKCQYKDRNTGRVCGSRHAIQLDHKFPYSLGGEHSEANLQLRCMRHNQYQAEEIFGKRRSLYPADFLKKSLGRTPRVQT